MKRLVAAVQTLVRVDVSIVDALGAGHALRELARDPRTPRGNREIFARVGAQLVAEADVAMMLAVGPATPIPMAPQGHGVFATGAEDDGTPFIKCKCNASFRTDEAFRRHLERARPGRAVVV